MKSSFGGFPFGIIDDCAMTVADVDAQGMAGGMFFPGGYAIDNGMVELMGFVAFELHAKQAVRLGITGEDHQPARDLIQAVDNPETIIIRFQDFQQGS
jgi:hypothetical protein